MSYLTGNVCTTTMVISVVCVNFRRHDANSHDNSIDKKMVSKSDTSSTHIMDVDHPVQDTETLQEAAMSADCSNQQQPARTFTYR